MQDDLSRPYGASPGGSEAPGAPSVDAGWDTWPNGVPYIDQDTRDENYRDTDALRDLISALWLYIGRYAETQLTTEQKELLADVVERQHIDGFNYDRWWQRPDPSSSGQLPSDGSET